MTLLNNGLRIAYDHCAGDKVCVIFCGGFNSNRHGDKAVALEQFCQVHGVEYVRFDYSGHGDSGGDFADGSISAWLSDTLSIIDRVACNKKVVLVGSSMGAWIALLAALKRPDIARGLLLIACAADMTRYYTERLKNANLEADDRDEARRYYSVANQYDDQQPYRIYQHLLNDGQQHCLLEQSIPLTIPVCLIHGCLDDVVPWQRSQQVLECLQGDDVTLINVKSGDHRLSRPQDLMLIKQQLTNLIQ